MIDATAPVLVDSAMLRAIAVTIVVLAVIVFTLSVVVFTHHVISDRVRSRNRRRFTAASSFLAPYVVGGDDSLQGAVANARRRFGDHAVSLVLRRSRYDVKGVSAAIVSEMLEEMDEVKRFGRQVGSRREWKRAQAVRALGECGGARARELLMEMVDDPSSEVRRAARDGLLMDHNEEAVRVAIRSFLDDLPRRSGWRRSFYSRLAAVASNDLLGLIHSGSLEDEELKLALEALGDSAAMECLPLAVRLASATNPELRATAFRVLGKLGRETEVPLAVAGLDDPEWFVRASAARALESAIGHRHLATRDYSLRSRVCRALGARLTDTSWWVRANAARALASVSPQGTDILMQMGAGEDDYARDAALAVLAMTELTATERVHVERLLIAAEERRRKHENEVTA